MIRALSIRAIATAIAPVALLALSAQGAGAVDQDVDIVDLAFSPASVTIDVGDTVTWTNTGDLPHTATADDGTFDSGILNNGGTFAFTFASAGTYDYFCEVHPSMQGTITVQGAAPTNTPTVAPTNTPVPTVTTAPTNTPTPAGATPTATSPAPTVTTAPGTSTPTTAVQTATPSSGTPGPTGTMAASTATATQAAPGAPSTGTGNSSGGGFSLLTWIVAGTALAAAGAAAYRLARR